MTNARGHAAVGNFPGSVFVRAGLILLAAGVLAADDSPPAVVVLSPPAGPMSIREWMKAGQWVEKRGRAGNFKVEEEALHLVSEDDSVLIGTGRGFPIDPSKTSLLAFECKVTVLPGGTDLTKADSDDCAFRVYVAFDHGRSLLGVPDTIAYAWSENEAVDSLVQSEHFDNLKYIPVVQGKAKLGEWVTVERDVAADYARAFGVARERVPPVGGIALKIDTNNLKGKAESFVRRVEFRAR
ncbi:MAG: DUF3047 domain-containing protein [Planctomycetes bacterium]|nr:DUF3047 domain-containing protein [Planctomycetota bacterium]